MAFKIVLTEFFRDFHNSVSTILFSVIVGFIICFVVDTSSYLNKIFASPRWNIDMLILPKGITPEHAAVSITKGTADGLIPLALFTTLSQQIQSSHDQNTGASLKILGFIPYINSQGSSEVAVTDNELKNFQGINQNSFWANFTFTDLKLKRQEFQPSSDYRTPEWGDQVLMGIIANGDPTELNNLKNLIDRKTIAQAFYVGSENSDTHLKLIKLEKGLFITTGFIFISTILGLLLALKNMKNKMSILELVLSELKYNKFIIKKVKFLQVLLVIILPILLGFAASKISFDIIQGFIFNT